MNAPLRALVSFFPLAAVALAQPAPAPLAAPGDTITLSPFEVKTDRDTGYRATNSAAAGRLAAEIKDVPMSISVVNEELLRDTAAFDAREAMRYVAAVDIGRSATATANFAQEFILRGFATPRRYLNGIPFSGLIDNAVVGRYEVIKGPNTLLYGVSEPGGTINTITKRPQFSDRFRSSVATSVSSFDDKRVEADTSGRLLKGEGFDSALRVTGSYADNETFRDFGAFTRETLSPQLALSLGKRVSVNLGYHFFRDENYINAPFMRLQSNSAIFAPSVEFNMRGPNIDAIRRSEVLLGELEVKLAEGLFFRSTYLQDWGKNYSNAWQVNANRIVDNVANRVPFFQARPVAERTTLADTNTRNELAWLVTTGPAKHAIVAGYDTTENSNINLQRRRNAFTEVTVAQYGQLGTLFPIDLTGNYPNLIADTRVETESRAFFATDQVQLLDGRLRLLGGVRRDTIDIASTNRVTRARTLIASKKTTPQGGALFALSKSLSIFGLYSESIVPNTQVNVDGRTFAPQTGQGYEAGVKFELLDGRLSGSVAHFNTQRQGIPRNKCTPNEIGIRPGCNTFDDTRIFEPSGEEESVGYDAELFFSPTPKWQILAGFSNAPTVVLKNNSNPERVGTTLPESARNQFKLFTKTQIPGTRWSTYGGMVYVSKRQAGFTQAVPALAAYTRFELGVSYGWKMLSADWTANLNWKNVTNKRYEDELVAPGAPSHAVFSVQVRF